MSQPFGGADAVREPFRDLRHDAIAEAGELLDAVRDVFSDPAGKSHQSTGYPINQLTHCGFSAPLSSCDVVIVRSFARAPDPPHLHIAAPPVSVIAGGVGHIVSGRTAPSSIGYRCPCLPF